MRQSLPALLAFLVGVSCCPAQEATTLKGHTGWVAALAFAPDGKTLATGNQDQTVKLWDVRSLQLRSVLGGDSYAFLLRAPQSANAEPGKEPNSLKAVREAGGNVSLEIRRGGVLLREQSLAAARVYPGELRLRVVRSGKRVSFQVDDMPALEFQDVMPLSSSGGAFGLYAPAGTRLQRLRGSRQALPATPSPLERGDALYACADYTEALAFYRDQFLVPGNREVGQEARVKAAFCLLFLNRPQEAAELFAQVSLEHGSDKGPRWPLVAACQLLILHGNQGNFADTDALLAGLANRYRVEEFADYVPQDVRTALIADSLQRFRGTNLPRATPADLRDLERAKALQVLFQATPLQRMVLGIALLRGYQLTGQLERAAQTAEELLDNDQYWSNVGKGEYYFGVVVEQYGWIMRERGLPKAALARVDQLLLEKPGVYRSQYLFLLPERARLHVALNQWEDAKGDLDYYFENVVPRNTCYRYYSGACLVRGCLRERHGDAAGARAAWQMGLYPDWLMARGPAEPDQAWRRLGQADGTEVINGLVLAGLTGDLSDADAEQLLAALLARSTNEANALNKEGQLLPPAILRDMWRSQRGRDSARAIAILSLPYADYLQRPLFLMEAELIRQKAMSGTTTQEQDDLIWKLIVDGNAAHARDKLAAPQLLALLLTWKGTTGITGWASLKGSLEPELRGPLAYVLGHRYLRLNKPTEAEDFFRTALKDAPAKSLLQRLAQAELDRPRDK